MAQGKSSLHSSCEGERGIVLESPHGNRASRCVEGGNRDVFLELQQETQGTLHLCR